MPKPINPFDPNANAGLYNVHFPDFAFWLQKTQPLVYDDALSYYEVLARIAAMINQLTKQVNDLTDAQKKFIEDATNLLNQIINQWNEMVAQWSKWENQWNAWEEQWNSWEEQWNQWVQKWSEWSAKIDYWDEQFNYYINKINELIKKVNEFLEKIENEWNEYKNEINEKITKIEGDINNIQGDVTNVTVNVDVMPIKKHGHVNVHAAGSEHSDTNYGSMDWYDLVYPEVTIRFISAIISATFNANPEGVTGAKRIGRFVTENVDIDDPNFTYLVDLLSNPAFGGASVYNNTKNIYYPAVINFPKKPDANTEYEILVPSWASVDNGDVCLFYIYEGGKTQLGTTTPDWYKNNVQ